MRNYKVQNRLRRLIKNKIKEWWDGQETDIYSLFRSIDKIDLIDENEVIEK